MLSPLPVTHYARVAPLFERLSAHHLFCAGVVSGRYEGTILVDDVAQPRSALVFRPGIWCYLAGSANNAAFNAALGAALQSKEYVGDKTNALLFIVDSADWRSRLAHLLPNRAPIATPRHLYLATAANFVGAQALSAEFDLHFIDETLPAKVDGDLPHEVQNVLTLRRNSAEPDQAAFGFVATHKRQCVGWSQIDVIVSAHGDLGFVTQDAFRRRGIGSALSGATISYALQHGLTTVHWDVHSQNVASTTIAKQHGLELAATFDQLLLIYGQVSYLANVAWQHLDDGQFDETHRICQQLLNVAGGQGYGHFLRGAAFAAQDAFTEAFEQLHLAVDHGFDDRFEVEMCQPLKRLRHSAEWRAFLDRFPA